MGHLAYYFFIHFGFKGYRMLRFKYWAHLQISNVFCVLFRVLRFSRFKNRMNFAVMQGAPLDNRNLKFHSGFQTFSGVSLFAFRAQK